MVKRWVMTGGHKHFFFAVSSHGYGHLAQIAPVINRLKQVLPETVISIQSSLPVDIISSRLNEPFNYIGFDADVGLIMEDALSVQVQATKTAYQNFHKHWQANYQQQIEILLKNTVDILIADIPYLPLLAAQALDIKTIAICSLNWVDILCGYFQQDSEMNHYMALMRKAYSQADVFLKPEPSMPMSWLSNTKTIAPLLTAGKNSRKQLISELYPSQKTGKEVILVLLALGGIRSDISLSQWPDYKNIKILLQDGYDEADRVKQTQWLHSIKDISLTFADIVQSVDIIITKPGYGLFAEAAFGAKPVLYVARGDWPEEVYLLQWLKQYVAIKEIAKEDLTDGIDESVIQDLLRRKQKTTINQDGAQEAVNYILEITI